MKTCPICKAQAFEDAEVCYGCLHHFVETDAPLSSNANSKEGAEQSSESTKTAVDGEVQTSGAPRVESERFSAPTEAPSRHLVDLPLVRPHMVQVLPTEPSGRGRQGWTVRFELEGAPASKSNAPEPAENEGGCDVIVLELRRGTRSVREFRTNEDVACAMDELC